MERMKELVYLLNRASKAYYQEDREIMDNREYDEQIGRASCRERV